MIKALYTWRICYIQHGRERKLVIVLTQSFSKSNLHRTNQTYTRKRSWVWRQQVIGCSDGSRGGGQQARAPSKFVSTMFCKSSFVLEYGSKVQIPRKRGGGGQQGCAPSKFWSTMFCKSSFCIRIRFYGSDTTREDLNPSPLSFQGL